eukprot:gene4599-14789_t
MPWVVKPLYGFISDSIPLFGYRRRSYLVLCGLTGNTSLAASSHSGEHIINGGPHYGHCKSLGTAFSTLAWLLLATVVNTSSMAVLTMVVASLGTAFSDVVVDSIVVERARGEPQATSGSLQSLCWGSSAVGSIASAYFSGSLVDAYGPSSLGGPPGDGGPSRLDLWRVNLRDLATRFKALLLQLWGALKQKRIILPTLFMFLWNASVEAIKTVWVLQMPVLPCSTSKLMS